MITPFKRVIGDGYKAVEKRLEAAIHVRFGLPAELPAELRRVLKAADSGAAFLEATKLAGFSIEEALKFFGPRPVLPAAAEREFLAPWPVATAEQRYLKRFRQLLGD
jgi:5'-deoxynucleotidase YfbR-like HD superfamily hydrolase